MTLPSSGPISLSQVNTELLISPPTTTISMNQSGVRFLTGQTTPGTQDSMSQLLGKSYVIANNSGILTGGSSYALPSTSGNTIKVLVIGGGGGGGGGSARTAHNPRGPGGGGGSGGMYYSTLSVTPGQTITFSIGGSGSGGGACDGGYNPGTSGGTGGQTSVSNGSTTIYANGGNGGDQGYDVAIGQVCPGGSAGSGNGSSVSIQQNGGNAQYGVTPGGGYGGEGIQINTTVGVGTPYSAGSRGVGGVGNDAGGGGGDSPNTPATTGTVYGAGGGGGGANNEFYGEGPGINGADGSNGALFIWWGY